MSRLHSFRELLDALDTPGGHIFISIVVGVAGVFMGALLVWLVWPDEKLAMLIAGMTAGMSGFLSIAAYAMRGKDRANGKDKPKEG